MSDALIYEMRHVYQYDYLSDGITQAIAWRDKNKNYIFPEHDLTGYLSQSLESDVIKYVGSSHETYGMHKNRCGHCRKCASGNLR